MIKLYVIKYLATQSYVLHFCQNNTTVKNYGCDFVVHFQMIFKKQWSSVSTLQLCERSKSLFNKEGCLCFSLEVSELRYWFFFCLSGKANYIVTRKKKV